MTHVTPVNWNEIEDEIDLEVWNRLTANFWLDTKVAVSNDLSSWKTLSDDEQELVIKVFAGLTTLDSLQSETGAHAMARFATTRHEVDVFNNIAFMESVHAKSYSTIFSTLCSTEQIEKAFDWANSNPQLQGKAGAIKALYESSNPLGLSARAASVLLESFLFYSGFYVAFHYSARGKLTNTADIIRLILRDEGVHGYYIGYKYQQAVRQLSVEQQREVEESVRGLAHSLYQIEEQYTRDLYDGLGWTERVLRYSRYNMNKAMNNLGYDGLFEDRIDVEPEILTQMSPDANETHDFFSGSGSSYVVGKVEETDDDDWA